VCLVVSLVALLAAASAGGAPAQSSMVGSGSGHFIETGGPLRADRERSRRGPARPGPTGTASAAQRARGAPPQNGGVQVYIEDNGNPVNGVPVDRMATEPPQPPESFDAAAGVCDYAVRNAG
jgi:hypothetical protein